MLADLSLYIAHKKINLFLLYHHSSNMGNVTVKPLNDMSRHSPVTFVIRGSGGLVVNTSDFGSRGRGLEPHSGSRVVFLSKKYLPSKSTGNTQEAVAPSQHD